MSDASFQTRYGVAVGLFAGAIRNGATEEQWSESQNKVRSHIRELKVVAFATEYWVDKGLLQIPERIYGCFGMTELEHGSNVAGVLTTATLDKETDEFVVHTPTLGATKWWIGGAASSATHCAVTAQLVVDGKRHGVKTFVVPMRDPKTFKNLPGVVTGDIGKKMGRDGIDNGYIQVRRVCCKALA